MDSMATENLKASIVKHLQRHGRDGQWVRQRRMRDCIHAESAKLFNQAAVELAMDGTVELDIEGPYRKRVIRLRLEKMPTDGVPTQ